MHLFPAITKIAITRITLQLVILWSVLSILSIAEASLLQFKPQSPVKISIQPLVTPIPGQTVDFIVTTSSAINVESVQIEIILPAGLQLQKGSLLWQGALSRNDNKAMQFTLLVPKSGLHIITAKATLGDTVSGQFAAIDTYRVGIQLVNRSVASPAVKYAQRDGLGIVQYQIP